MEKINILYDEETIMNRISELADELYKVYGDEEVVYHLTFFKDAEETHLENMVLEEFADTLLMVLYMFNTYNVDYVSTVDVDMSNDILYEFNVMIRMCTNLIDKENIKTFIENLTSKNLSTTFLFSVYNEEDEKLSLTEFYYKWNGEPPEGWLANYCKCGSFDPQTPDLGELKTPNLHYKLPELYRPTNIFIEEIWKIEIMSNNMLRFVMDDYYTYNCMILQQLKTNQL